MPNDSTPAEKLSQLAQEAHSFFEQVRGEPTNAWRLSEWTWGRLSREQQANAGRLGHDLATADGLAGARHTKCTSAGQAGPGAVLSARPNHGRGTSIPVVSHPP